MQRKHVNYCKQISADQSTKEVYSMVTVNNLTNVVCW